LPRCALDRFLGHPRPPGYKHKQKGRFLLTYNDQAFSRRWLRKGLVKPSQLDVFITTQHTNIRQVRIVPRRDHYVVEIVYQRAPEEYHLDEDLITGVDLGIDILITLTSNQTGFIPVVNGLGLSRSTSNTTSAGQNSRHRSGSAAQNVCAT
jgi:putative transposase